MSPTIIRILFVIAAVAALFSCTIAFTPFCDQGSHTGGWGVNSVAPAGINRCGYDDFNRTCMVKSSGPLGGGQCRTVADCITFGAGNYYISALVNRDAYPLACPLGGTTCPYPSTTSCAQSNPDGDIYCSEFRGTNFGQCASFQYP